MDSSLHPTKSTLRTMLLILTNHPHETLFLYHLDDFQSLHLLERSEGACYACAANTR
jgi:hypothetical protein